MYLGSIVPINLVAIVFLGVVGGGHHHPCQSTILLHCISLGIDVVCMCMCVYVYVCVCVGGVCVFVGMRVCGYVFCVCWCVWAWGCMYRSGVCDVCNACVVLCR